jgi:hypothetical protein
VEAHDSHLLFSSSLLLLLIAIIVVIVVVVTMLIDVIDAVHIKSFFFLFRS